MKIRTLVALVAVLPVAVVAVVLVSLLSRTGDEIAARLEDSMLRTSSEEVQQDVTVFLREAVRVSDLYARRAYMGVLPVSGLEAWENWMLDDLAVPSGVASISFANEKGETTWLLRHLGRLEVGRVGPARIANEYTIDSGSRQVGTTPLRTYPYDATQRPWYTAALKAGFPTWTPIYFWFGENGRESEAGTGYTRPIRDGAGKVVGVLVVDVTLGSLSNFLTTLAIARQGQVFIVDDRGMLVAASHGAVNSKSGERIALADAEQASGRAVAAVLADQGGPTRAEQTLRLDVDGEPTRVRVSALRPYPGVNWNVVAVVPESVLLGATRSLQRRAMWAGAGAVLGALLLGIILSRRLSKPIVALAEHVQKVGDGDFDSRLHLRAARELRELSEELNKMSAGLKQRMELEQSLVLATKVQQSLLPHESPKIAGVDVAGQSRYCESTGGDYYDFIEVAGLPGGQVLVAVGDVMGHGIASALLMATARGALRARAAAPGLSLGELMTSVNRVLAKDSRSGKFMTMLLLVLDPVTHAIRWASAGHGSPLVYDRQKDEFTEPEGGDIPLGIDEFATYEEYEIEAPAKAVVVLGTDGIWEAADPSGASFGYERLRNIVRRTAGLSSADLLHAIDRELAAFCGECPAKDDITAVVLQTKAAA